MYHVTSKQLLPSILKQGLLPCCDKRGRGYENEPPAVYLFNTLADLEDGICNWLGDCFSENEELVVLKVTLPPEIRIEDDPELPGSAYRVFEVVAPEHLKIVPIEV